MTLGNYRVSERSFGEGLGMMICDRSRAKSMIHCNEQFVGETDWTMDEIDELIFYGLLYIF